MAIEFVEQHRITVKSKGQTGTLLAREPNALEGARYMAALQRHGVGLRETDPDAFEATIALHVGLLVACVEGSEDFTPAFPAGGTEAERRAWLLRLHSDKFAQAYGDVLDPRDAEAILARVNATAARLIDLREKLLDAAESKEDTIS